MMSKPYKYRDQIFRANIHITKTYFTLATPCLEFKYYEDFIRLKNL